MTKKEINPYVTLICTHCEFFKEDDLELESPVVYNIIKDELYELDDEAFQFLKKCSGRNPFTDLLVNEKIDENIDFMLDEGIIRLTEGNEIKKLKPPHSPIPSLYINSI